MFFTYSARLHNPMMLDYSTIMEFNEPGYKSMPWVNETFSGYLSPASASSLKRPCLPGSADIHLLQLTRQRVREVGPCTPWPI